MKHLANVSAMRDDALRHVVRTEPGFADAKSDLSNAIYQALQDFVYQKKNEVAI